MGLPPPPHPRPGSLREAASGVGVRLRLPRRIADDEQCFRPPHASGPRRDEWIEIGVMEALREK